MTDHVKWYDDKLWNRYWSKVDKNINHPQGCWMWTSDRDAGGYGRFRFNKMKIRSQRMAWALYNGGYPPRHMEVGHKCDNSFCQNPDHLHLITRQRNGWEKCVRGRAAIKLTKEDVIEILASDERNHVLAEKYGVSRPTISQIRSRKIWRYVFDDPNSDKFL